MTVRTRVFRRPGGVIRSKNEVKKWHKLSLAAFIPMI